MQLGKIIALLSIAAMGAAEDDLEAGDVPRACRPACQPSIDLSASCEKSTHGDDDYRTCFCEAADSQAHLTECASCVKDQRKSDHDGDDDDNDNDNDSDSDVADLMKDCGWSFNNASGPYPSSATPSAGATVTQTPPGQTSAVTSNPDSTSIANPASGTANPPGSMAGTLNPKDAFSPFLAALIIGLPIIL
ncbi:hypothetical protein F4861DRAFT_375232 [Xylaria intraflava]|nr:hypothetical protein F4861DRAFT_375232 [Xylaria intraflava]